MVIEYIVQQNCPVGATLGAGGAAPAARATFSVVVNVHKFCQSTEYFFWDDVITPNPNMPNY